MAYGEVQIGGGGPWNAYVRRDSDGAQIDCKFEAWTVPAGITEAEADAFFQDFINHVATMPGFTVTGGKAMNASQVITPDSPTP